MKIRYTKGGDINHTYWLIWVGKLCITINVRKRRSIFSRIKNYFNNHRNITINI